MWTDERINRLKELWHKGASAKEIGDDLGVTKNSIISKLHRLGLKYADQPGAKPLPPRAKVSKHRFRIRPLGRLPPAYEPSAPVSLQDAMERHCRWPLNDVRPIESFLFCGATHIENSPYCLKHSELSHERR